MFGIACLYYVSSYQGSLRETDNIELLVTENWMFLYFLASLVHLERHRAKDWSDLSVSDFYTFSVPASPLPHFFFQ